MTVSAPGRGLAIGGALAILGGALAIFGTLLPWEQLDRSLAAAAKVSSSPIGIEFDDGKIFVFVASLTILSYGCSLAARWLPAGLVATVGRLIGNGAGVSAVAGGYVVGVSLLYLGDIADGVDKINGLPHGSASLGLGLQLDLVAGAVILAGSAIGLLIKRDQRPDRRDSFAA